MKIISFIKEAAVIEKILRQCELWKEPPMRGSPVEYNATLIVAEPTLDYGFTSTITQYRLRTELPMRNQPVSSPETHATGSFFLY
jgi:hypothetical protein